MVEDKKKKLPERKGAWWRIYTKEFLDEPEAVKSVKPSEKPRMAGAESPRFRAEATGTELKARTFDPFEEMQRVQKEMDRMFKQTFNSALFPFASFPRVVKLNEGIFRKSMIQVNDIGKAIAVRAEMPGIKKEDIKIRLEGRDLILDAQSQKKKEDKSETSQSFSQSFIGFRNIVRLSTDVDKKSSRAEYKNGILIVILQKKESAGDSGDIPIE